MSAGRTPHLARTVGVPAAILATVLATALAATAQAGPRATARPATLAAYARPAGARAARPAGVGSGRPAKWAKGVGAWAFNGGRESLRKSGASWYYTWRANPEGVHAPKGVAFVPMIWGPNSVTTQNLQQAKRESNVLLGFNEPDLSKESNMSVSQALSLWPQLEATGMRLGSPAVAGGADTPGGWLDQFMQGAAARHYRVNFIALHRYEETFNVSDAVADLKSYIQGVWNMYHKPIWLTEFAMWRFNPSTFPSPATEAAFLTAAIHMLQGLPYVWRYAWFALPADSNDGPVGLFRPGATVTTAGLAFENIDR
jgi:hypothetical protein